ncbi:MAG: saccharopine dehydrogenase NADP-binding domain-containing protein, partial [Rhodobacter sp.]
MKVLVVGGYGVFGERLARLLLRDGHQVTVAGRDLAKAKALAAQLGCGAQRIDRKGDLGTLADHDVVIDAAGPFQMQGDDPWRLVRAAIRARVHYLDLSDSADFCTGISVMDREAKAAGVCVISGLSTVPALSSAAVHALAAGQTPRVIDVAVLPG